MHIKLRRIDNYTKLWQALKDRCSQKYSFLTSITKLVEQNLKKLKTTQAAKKT